MRYSELVKHVGHVVVIEMVNGVKLTTKLESVEKDPDDGQWYANTGSLLVFMIQIVGQNPDTKALEVRLQDIIPYGIPEMQPKKKNSIELGHIVMAAPAQKGFADQYSQMTGSLVLASANTPLPPMDDLGAAMAKITGR